MTLIIVFLSFLLVISLFKNISYPLFWADEGMTVMGGVRVLQFGYPKVHDGKNVFYDLQSQDKTLGIDQKTDAYIGGANWGQYYVAALGVKLAEMSEDFFDRTALVRIIFVLTGLTGLLLLALLGTRFFYSGLSKRGFLALFLFLEAASVPLALHVREVRYYPLTVFLLALIIFVFARYRMLREIRYRRYAILSVIVLCLLFMTFSPAYFIFLVAILLFEAVSLGVSLLLRKSGNKRPEDATLTPRPGPFRYFFQNTLPCALSLLPVYPLMVFFDTLHISGKLTEYYASGFQTDAMGRYMSNLSFIWDFFSSSELIFLAIFLKMLLLSCFLVIFVRDRNAYPLDKPKVIFSAFLSVLFIVYFFAIPKVPNPLFTRYFIPLQPLLSLLIIFDAAVIYNLLSRYQSPAVIYGKVALGFIFTAFICVNISHNLQFLKGHVYELTHQYKGPLDYVIPFIKERYGNTEGLVIATNYEDASFMYYLNAKVTIGFVGNNLKEDVQVQPDIIVYRNWWRNFRPEFMNFMQRYPYEKIFFPVIDYAVNNIPELHRPPPICHQFQTLECSDDLIKTAVFIRK